MPKIVLDEAPKTVEECPFRKWYRTVLGCTFIGMNCVLNDKSFDECPACTTKKEN